MTATQGVLYHLYFDNRTWYNTEELMNSVYKLASLTLKSFKHSILQPYPRDTIPFFKLK